MSKYQPVDKTDKPTSHGASTKDGGIASSVDLSHPDFNSILKSASETKAPLVLKVGNNNFPHENDDGSISFTPLSFESGRLAPEDWHKFKGKDNPSSGKDEGNTGKNADRNSDRNTDENNDKTPKPDKKPDQVEHSILKKKTIDHTSDNSHQFPVFEEQREQAKQKLAHNEQKWGTGNLSAQDVKAAHDIQNALLDGNIDALSSALQGLNNNPERMKVAVDEAERNIQVAGGKLEMTKSDGKQYIYGENSNAAVQIDPLTGNTAVRPISRKDGMVTVEPGEVISSDASKELRSIADGAVRDVAPIQLDAKPNLYQRLNNVNVPADNVNMSPSLGPSPSPSPSPNPTSPGPNPTDRD